jgi:hypothetical protein
MYSQGINLLDDDGKKTDIAQKSALVRSLQPETNFRIFCPKEVMRGEGAFKPIAAWCRSWSNSVSMCL